MEPRSFFSALDRHVKIGVCGTGFIARGLLVALANSDEFEIGRVLTRRPFNAVTTVDGELLTQSISELVETCDIVVECSGDVWRGAEVVEAAMQAGRPVVTMGTEFHVTVGSYFVDRGYLTEAEGDQPGTLAAHVEDVVAMGFKPLVYGNMKGYLNHNPYKIEMEYWSKKNGISLKQTTSFTDGTKLQMEQALVANHYGAELARRGMVGPQTMPLEVAGAELGRLAKARGAALSDYVLNRALPAGVFVVAEHRFERPEVLRYLKLGDGPYITLSRPFHLCHLEMIKTLRRVVAGKEPLMNNSTMPHVVVASVAKQPLKAGQVLQQALGGYLVRGEAVMAAEVPDAVPLGLLDGARILCAVEKGQTLNWADVETREGLALNAALALRERMAAGASST